ncbi:PspA/IM30 family protein [Paenibacillus allorhizosphaerae]|uniref:Protein LiaH n=1 Tax=Paenibacillus allorhizosphaerae TaxID=2849866 RepID=A0ABM8VMD5_9BACL|nr:PspA/IM30 family protein [Paenibacillus allorhizosphaerae]CAG7649858.1 Protein LiaH [Paenibacillus allorhizosphaerae]
MGVFSRIMDLSKAAANEALNKLEDPVMMLNHYLRSMKEEIVAVERTLSKQIATERALKQRIDEYNQLAAQWENKAADLVANGLEAEARHALSTKLHYVDKALECAEQYGAARLRTEELNQQLEQTKSEYAVMQEKRTELAARAQKMASQQAKTSPSAGHYSFEGGYAASGFQRIEEKIMQWEAQTELAGQSYTRGNAPFADSTADHPSEASRDARVEEQLARLRQQSSVKEQ